MLDKIYMLKKKSILSLSFLLILNVVVLIPQYNVVGFSYQMIFLAFSTLLVFYSIVRQESENSIRQTSGAFSIFLTFLFCWMVVVVYVGYGDPILYPTPMRVLSLLLEVFPQFLKNLEYSFVLFGTSFIISIIIAFPVGLFLGCNDNIRLAWDPYIKVLSLISPIAYTPYIVGVMPTFRIAQIFVVSTGIFWPVLKWAIYGVTTFNKEYILTAKLLGLSRFAYYTRILIPGIMPAVLTGISASISGGFTVLVAAEIIGSRHGLGFFIKYFADFMNYHKVIVGIIYLGISVCFITWLYEKVQSHILSWQRCERKHSCEFLRKIQKA